MRSGVPLLMVVLADERGGRRLYTGTPAPTKPQRSFPTPLGRRNPARTFRFRNADEAPMPLLTVLLMQVAMPPPDIDFDLRDVPAVRPCTEARGDEIVVCGRPDHDQHRLPALPDATYVETPPRAEMKLFGDVVGSAVMEAEEVANGVVSNRIMLRMKIPF
jgi:hypothetical protein